MLLYFVTGIDKEEIMVSTISFEQIVKVKLTEKGIEKYEQFFGELSDGQQISRSRFPALSSPDADGWYSIELWMLLSVFGGYSVRSLNDTAEIFDGNIMMLE